MRHLNKKRRKKAGLQVPNGQPSGLQLQVPKGRAAQQGENRPAAPRRV
jgi:hypothetical protein